jgi:glutathione S-transferase/RNA polymerase-associated protein
MLTLLEHPLSPFAQKVKIALREKDVPFEVTTPAAIGSGQTDFADANPRGEVPVLFTDKGAIFDSSIILEYIEDAYPTPPLRPVDPYDRATARTIEEVCDTHYEAINWGLSEITFFRRAEGDLAETMKAEAARQWTRLNAWLERRLGEREWFGGETFGWGDLSVAPFLQGAAGFGHRPPEGTPLADWFKRARGRPSVRQTLNEARDAISAMAQAAGGVSQGAMRREYRDYRLEWMIKTGGMDVVLKGLQADNIRFTSEAAFEAAR